MDSILMHVMAENGDSDRTSLSDPVYSRLRLGARADNLSSAYGVNSHDGVIMAESCGPAPEGAGGATESG